MVGGTRPVSKAASVSAAKAAMSPNGTNTTRVTEKISTRPEPGQQIDGAVGEAVDAQDERHVPCH